MEYMRLLKLLYMADRMSWEKFGRPITGDDYLSMDHGPVLSQTYNLVKSEGEVAEEETGPWQETVERKSRYDVRLRREPDLSSLSNAETELLRESYRQFGKISLWALVRQLHELLPEWSNPKGSSIEIWPETILRALGKTEQHIKEVSQEATERVHFERLLGIR